MSFYKNNHDICRSYESMRTMRMNNIQIQILRPKMEFHSVCSIIQNSLLHYILVGPILV